MSGIYPFFLSGYKNNKMKYAILDVESTIFQKGNPYAERNKLCLAGLRIAGKNFTFKIEYDEEPYSANLQRIADHLSRCSVVVGFNLKFDLAWLARYGIVLNPDIRIFDCQLGYFIYRNQLVPFPSLDDCLSHFNLGTKSEVVPEDYWALGIDTPSVPLDVLTSYLNTDLEKTDELYQALLPRCGHPLYGLHMQDERVLLEMEINGLCFDWANMGKAAEEAQAELTKIDEAILHYVPDAFRPHFNGQSGDHISWLLYGGVGTVRIGTPVERVLASGRRAGERETRYKWSELQVTFPRLVTPPEGSELKKDGFFATDEATLMELGIPAAKLAQLILGRSKLEKLLGTYYEGIPKLVRAKDWTDGLVHGTFNQCRVVTGRLSSEKPNEQNFPDELMPFIVSRFS